MTETHNLSKIIINVPFCCIQAQKGWKEIDEDSIKTEERDRRRVKLEVRWIEARQ